MARIFITGSTDGLGLRSAKALSQRGHDVYLHARNAQRAADARSACPAAKDVFVADLTSTEETKALAAQLSATGPWDAIVHNAGLMHGVSRLRGREGLPALFAVNTLAPYLLACLVRPPPARHVFVSSSMHRGGDAGLRGDVRACGYSDSKLHDLLLALWFARRFAGTGTACNAMDPGWVATKMGGAGAPDDLDAAVDTYVMLAEGTGRAEGRSGGYWYHGRERSYKKEADDEAVQEKLVRRLEEISGVKAPE